MQATDLIEMGFTSLLGVFIALDTADITPGISLPLRPGRAVRMALIVETRKPRLWVVCSRVYSKVRWLETRNQALGPFPVGLTGLRIHVACKQVKHSARGR